MAKYQKKNWRQEWVNAKASAHLSDRLFRKGLGKKLDAQEATYDKMMKADVKTFPKLFALHGKNAVEIRKIVDAYRVIVKNNGDDVDAMNVLNGIDTRFLAPQLDDRLDRQRALGLHK